MKRKSLLAVLMTLAVLVAGGFYINSRQSLLTHTNKANFNMIFKYGVGGKNVLNTYDGTFTKDMVQDAPITVELTLTEDELNSIYQKMTEIDFFKLSPEDKQDRPVLSPQVTYYYRVDYDGLTKEITWLSGGVRTGSGIEKLQELNSLIISIIESKVEYQNLPEAKGGYL